LCAAAPTMAQAPAGGPVNTGPIDPATWKRGPLYAAPASPLIWNPVKLAMAAGKEFAFGTQGPFNIEAYCTQAKKTAPDNARGIVYPATWTETQHSASDLTQVWAMWNQPCVYSPVSAAGVYTEGAHVPGMRPATLLKRDLQKGLDGGAMVFMVPTVDTVEQAKDIIDLVYYPPIGKRAYGPSQAEKIYANVPGGYRQTFNDNVVLVLMIETILGSQQAAAIAALPQTFALFAAASDLGNFSGYLTGDADYEVLIRNAYAAAKSNNKAACSSLANRGRINTIAAVPPAPFNYSWNCYQN
jgi:4-hydroxy-2-oxoheptanedioate aldolase